jgi:hypothetical protein
LFYEEKALKTVHKFLLSARGWPTSIRLPAGAQIQRVDTQFGSPYVWVCLDTALPYDQPYEFLILGTGDAIPDGYWPIGTFFEHQGNAMVWHAFARMPAATLASHVHTGVANV